ncbi:MAG: signal peptidase II [Clostridia bacterium]|nr:signal peptidase II [Clostridia bacterium]
MQGIRADRRKIIIKNIIIPAILLLVLIVIDQGSKHLFTKINNEKNIAHNPIYVIKNFFCFTYTLNTGSAYSLFAGKSWAQLFFKILTIVALFVFFYGAYYSIKHKYKVMTYGLSFLISGTVGNFIDRLFHSAVTDFMCLEVYGNEWFGVFNFADLCLTAGVIICVIHFLFLDENAVFKKKKDD